MSIVAPKRRPAFAPIGRLRTGPFGGGKKGLMASLNLTAMVDMFTTIVIFLLQTFSASGEISFMQKDLKIPDADQASVLNELGPVVTLFRGQILIDGKTVGKVEELDEAEAGIPKLAEELTKAREAQEKLDERRGKPRDPNQPFSGHVIVQADKETDFMLVRKAIFSVNEAGWAHIQFIVRGTGKGGDSAEDMKKALQAGGEE